MSADGPEQREADRRERDTYDHDREADRADEERDRSPFADMVFDIARANVQASTTAYQTGYDAGYRDGLAKSLAMIESGVYRLAADLKADQANVCPTCHGRGATAINSHSGKTVYYCNCETQS